MSSRSLRRAASWIGVAGFLALLAAPSIGHVLAPARDVSVLENRRLASPPSLADARSDWAAFPARLTTWLEDRFGFRDQLLATYVALDRTVQIGDARQAVRGDDGWLFATTADSLLSHQGRMPFASGEADAWLDRAAAIAADAEAAGARFVVLIAPDKQTIYPEYLSAYPRRFSDETRRETLIRRASERGLAIVSPSEAIIAAKAEGEVYYKTGSHWSPRGAYVAYRALAEALRAEGVPIDVVSEERVTWRPQDGFVGEIYGLLGEANGAPETYDVEVIVDPAAVIETVALPDLSWEGFSGRRVTMEARGRPSILMLGDSFGDPLAPYLQESFDELTFAHHRLGAFPPDAIEPGRYDVVVLETVERFLNRPFEGPPAP